MLMIVDGELVFVGSESADSSECRVVVKVGWLVAERSRLRSKSELMMRRECDIAANTIGLILRRRLKSTVQSEPCISCSSSLSWY